MWAGPCGRAHVDGPMWTGPCGNLNIDPRFDFIQFLTFVINI